jgi:hypothetical protein
VSREGDSHTPGKSCQRPLATTAQTSDRGFDVLDEGILLRRHGDAVLPSQLAKTIEALDVLPRPRPVELRNSLTILLVYEDFEDGLGTLVMNRTHDGKTLWVKM